MLHPFKEYLHDLIALRKQYGRDCMYIDIPYLRYPEMMDVKILDETFEQYMVNTVDYMQTMEKQELIHKSETDKLKRIIEYWRSQRSIDHSNHRQNFKVYTQELHKRRSTDFATVFPNIWAGTMQFNTIYINNISKELDPYCRCNVRN